MIRKSPFPLGWATQCALVVGLSGSLGVARLEAAEDMPLGRLPARLRLAVVTVGPVSADLREAIEMSARRKLQAAGCSVVHDDETGPIPAVSLALFTSEARGNCSFCLNVALHEQVRPERSVATIIPAATWTTWKMDLSGGATHAEMLRSADEAVDDLVEAGNVAERQVRGTPPGRVEVKVDGKTNGPLSVSDQGKQ